MIFANNLPKTAGQTWLPVLGGLDFFQPVELADFFQARVNQLPGAGTVGTDFASVLSGAAAWAV